jgi:hypothetical protein
MKNLLHNGMHKIVLLTLNSLCSKSHHIAATHSAAERSAKVPLGITTAGTPPSPWTVRDLGGLVGLQSLVSRVRGAATS